MFRGISAAVLTVPLLGWGTVSLGQTRPADPPIAGDHTTVVWVSIDGFRHDYLERFHPPTLSRLKREGAFTTRETPIFPSLTFPNHVAQVTGVGVSGHGIPMNAFLDDATGKTYSFPDLAPLLRAEPIWVTAERQGVRTCCVDWPMSHGETGPVEAAYFDATFNTDEADGHRLDRIIDLLKADHNPHPYRLVMGYMSGVDHVGHSAGPTSPRIGEAVAQADRDVDHFLRGITAWFDATHGPADELVVLFTTDHGMTNVKELVNLDRLIGADLGKGIKIVTSGPVATIHTERTPADRADQLVQRLSPYPFLTAWLRGRRAGRRPLLGPVADRAGRGHAQAGLLVDEAEAGDHAAGPAGRRRHARVRPGRVHRHAGRRRAVAAAAADRRARPGADRQHAVGRDRVRPARHPAAARGRLAGGAGAVSPAPEGGLRPAAVSATSLATAGRGRADPPPTPTVKKVHPMSNLKTLGLCAALLAGGLVSVGCHGDQGSDASAMPDTSGMSKDDLTTKGDAMVRRGQMMKADAQAMPDGAIKDGLSKDDLMTQADEMIKNGQMMKDKGM